MPLNGTERNTIEPYTQSEWKSYFRPILQDDAYRIPVEEAALPKIAAFTASYDEAAQILRCEISFFFVFKNFAQTQKSAALNFDRANPTLLCIVMPPVALWACVVVCVHIRTLKWYVWVLLVIGNSDPWCHIVSPCTMLHLTSGSLKTRNLVLNFVEMIHALDIYTFEKPECVNVHTLS